MKDSPRLKLTEIVKRETSDLIEKKKIVKS